MMRENTQNIKKKLQKLRRRQLNVRRRKRFTENKLYLADMVFDDPKINQT